MISFTSLPCRRSASPPFLLWTACRKSCRSMLSVCRSPAGSADESEVSVTPSVPLEPPSTWRRAVSACSSPLLSPAMPARISAIAPRTDCACGDLSFLMAGSASLAEVSSSRWSRSAPFTSCVFRAPRNAVRFVSSAVVAGSRAWPGAIGVGSGRGVGRGVGTSVGSGRVGRDNVRCGRLRCHVRGGDRRRCRIDRRLRRAHAGHAGLAARQGHQGQNGSRLKRANGGTRAQTKHVSQVLLIRGCQAGVWVSRRRT